MPTAAKLIAGVVFALVLGFAAHLYIPGLPDGAKVGRVREVSALIGLLCGWRVMGVLTGRGYTEAMGIGVRTSVTAAFWILLFFSIWVMVVRSTKMIYDGPMEAVLDVMSLMLQYGTLMVAPMVVGALIFGGMIGGFLTEWGGRRWR